MHEVKNITGEIYREIDDVIIALKDLVESLEEVRSFIQQVRFEDVFLQFKDKMENETVSNNISSYPEISVYF